MDHERQAAGERWIGGTSGPFLVVVGSLLLTLAVALLVTAITVEERRELLGGTVTLVGASVVVLSFVSVEVTIDREGLRARSRPFALARVHLPLEEIESARVVLHRTFSLGISSGWGYRGSLRLFRRAAWVLRSGPAIELDLRGGKRFTITVDDAETGAATLQRLLTPTG